MPKRSLPTFDSVNFLGPLILGLYLCIGFVPNLEAVDKIAPQWLCMSLINLLSIVYFLYSLKSRALAITTNLKALLSLTYIAFIIWASASTLYAINPTEVIVNISRQANVFLMFFSMSIFLFFLKNKLRFIPWLITLILGIEIFSVLSEALEMLNTLGYINSGDLKGVTANRNITAFSLAIKIPFVLFLIHLLNKTWLKLILSFLICMVMLGLSMIQSRASFIAVGLIFIAYTALQIVLYLKENKRFSQLLNLGYFLIPLLLAITINQSTLSDKGADAISRAATISLSTNDGSVNQRLRYYEDVLTHLLKNPIFGVGLGNWKLKSIDYDSKDIVGYVVPYHAHSDFIQLGAELGIIGFLLYLGIFIWALYYAYILIRFSDLEVNEKVFLFLIITSLGVYSVDANLNFPIARPQVLVVWTLIMGIITVYFQKYKGRLNLIKTNNTINRVFLIAAILIVIPSIYVSNKVYESLKGQMFLLQDFNSNQFNVPLNQIDNIVPNIPNITVTTIPINSVKARYFVNSRQYDKALALLDKGTTANPYLFYSEVLKSQIYQQRGQLDSAKIYSKKAFFGLPNNDLHSSRYINLINITRDRDALEEAFELLTFNNKINNWKNYLIIANSLYPKGDQNLKDRAERAMKIFPGNQEFIALYREIVVGQIGVKAAAQYSSNGLKYYNERDYKNAAIEFEKAIESNPLDYTHYENAATSNYLIGNIEKALEQINVVINDLNPVNGKCEYIKALIFIRMGDPIGACPLFETSKDSGYVPAEASYNQYCR